MELQKAEYYDEMQRVVDAMMRGETNATQLARDLSMPRKKVLDYMDEWSKIAQNHPDIKARARESLTAMDVHYNLIIKEMWNIVNTAENDAVRAKVLKDLADVEVKRNEALTKAGLFDDAGIADELVEMEELADKIKTLLQNVAQKYPETRLFIMEGLGDIFGTGGSVPTNDSIMGEITSA